MENSLQKFILERVLRTGKQHVALEACREAFAQEVNELAVFTQRATSEGAIDRKFMAIDEQIKVFCRKNNLEHRWDTRHNICTFKAVK